MSKNCGGLANANYSLPEGQAVKLTFFAPWIEVTVIERDFRIMEWSLRKGDNNKKDILAKFHWHLLTKNTVTKCLLVLFSDGYILLFFIVIYLEIFFPKVRALIGYFKVTCHLTMKLFPAQISQQVTCKIYDVRGQQYTVTHECWPTTAVTTRFNEFPASRTNHLKTGPLGNSQFCFPQITMLDSPKTNLTVSFGSSH